jgi:hypothetical protein
VNGNQPARRPKKNAPAAAKGRGGGRGGQKRGKKQGKKKSDTPAIDPRRPLWENPAGEAELQALVGSVRPARNPTALVRSLGEPPLGKFSGNAQHYYEAVYEKAQRFAVAMATANGLRVIDDAEDDGTGDPDVDGDSPPPTTTG